jgi:signal transduction histidine kinase
VAIPDLGEVLAAWPFAASFAAAASARSVREVRRRTALNEALHELRRPLQALALSVPGGPQGAQAVGEGAGSGGSARIESTVWMAAAALERLECEINGEPLAPVRRPVASRLLAEAALARWRGAAARAGHSLELRWRAGDAVLVADEDEIARALDNLIVNAIEHGGPRIEVEARTVAGRLRIAVRDSGPRRGEVRRRPVGAAARLSGRRRHGHGLRLVRRIAAEHGGRFELRRSQTVTEALLELPLFVSGERA